MGSGVERPARRGRRLFVEWGTKLIRADEVVAILPGEISTRSGMRYSATVRLRSGGDHARTFATRGWSEEQFKEEKRKRDDAIADLMRQLDPQEDR